MGAIMGAFALGLLIGVACTIVIFRVRTIGALRVDVSDPNGSPLLFLELWTPAERVKDHKYVALRVNIKDDISQK